MDQFARPTAAARAPASAVMHKVPRQAGALARPYAGFAVGGPAASVSSKVKCTAASAEVETKTTSDDAKPTNLPGPERPDSTLMSEPYVVLITGSTKGLGKSLARRFLEAGDSVVICSRTAEAVDASVSELGAEFGADRVKGIAADVSKNAEVAALADFAVEEYGRVDLWINNAGSNAYSYKPLMDLAEDDLSAIVSTNLLGTMICCKEAIRIMRDQPAGGHIFNMDGAGADGAATPRFAAYGATKRSLEQLGKSLQKEIEDNGIKGVGVHNLSPGMVTTELLMSGADTSVAKFFINCLAEEPKDVAEFLVPRVRSVPAAIRNSLSFSVMGSISQQYIRFLTKPKAYGNILRRLIRGERKDRFVEED